MRYFSQVSVLLGGWGWGGGGLSVGRPGTLKIFYCPSIEDNLLSKPLPPQPITPREIKDSSCHADKVLNVGVVCTEM